MCGSEFIHFPLVMLFEEKMRCSSYLLFLEKRKPATEGSNFDFLMEQEELEMRDSRQG